MYIQQVQKIRNQALTFTINTTLILGFFLFVWDMLLFTLDHTILLTFLVNSCIFMANTPLDGCVIRILFLHFLFFFHLFLLVGG